MYANLQESVCTSLLKPEMYEGLRILLANFHTDYVQFFNVTNIISPILLNDFQNQKEGKGTVAPVLN
jgi:hypothetical protein